LSLISNARKHQKDAKEFDDMSADDRVGPVLLPLQVRDVAADMPVTNRQADEINDVN
jgi:hypothetical protein